MKKSNLFLLAVLIGFVPGLYSAENLINDGSFEEGLGKWGYLSMRGKVLNLDRSTCVSDGDEAITMRFESIDPKNLIDGKYGAWGRLHRIVEVTPGETYQVTGFVHADDGFEGILSLLVKAGNKTGTIQLFADSAKQGVWQKFTGEFIPTEKECSIFLNAMGNRGDVTFDDISLFQVKPDTGIVKNIDFSKAMTNWNFSNPTGKVSGTVDGNGFLMTVVAPPAQVPGQDSFAWGRLHQENLKFTPGKTYRLKLKVRTSKDFDGGYAIWLKNATSQNLVAINHPSTQGEEKSLEATFTPTLPEATLYLNLMANQGNVRFYDLQVE